MQNKGLVKFFAIIFAVVSIYQLSFTYIAHNIEKKAKAFAAGDESKELAYLDSIGKQEVYNLGFTTFTYNEVRDKKINKGLDLEGGINVILQVSVKDVLKGLANHSKDPVFNKALDEASKNRQGNQSYLDAFFIAFEKESKGTIKLASPDIFANRNLSDDINYQMSNKEVQAVLRKKVEASTASAFEIVRKRIDKFGVTQPNIQSLGETGRILVELPGAKDVDRIKKLLQSTAQLEFWEVYASEQITPYLYAVNEALKKTEKAEGDFKTNDVKISEIDSLLTDISKDTTTLAKSFNPLFDKIAAGGGGPIVSFFSPKDTAVINGYLKREDIKKLIPAEQRFVKFVWGKPTTIKVSQNTNNTAVSSATPKSIDAVALYALIGNRENQAPLGGGTVVEARADFDNRGKPSVSMRMSISGAKKWEELTTQVAARKGAIAIVLDNVVYSAPNVNEPISGGSSIISGDFSITETKDLENILRAGKLPAGIDIVQSEVVGPSLGQEAIDNGITSSIIGLILVSLWMLIYYGRSGWYANIALGVNLLFLFGILASLGAVLTLPGIAGIVLTMGTAVDANIIIYERAKEELKLGKSLKEAIQFSFSWRGAMSSITDANVTHILTGLVLLIFGTGPIKGFATTLLIGIGTSLFTAIFITRMLLDWSLERNNTLTFVTAFSKNLFNNFHYDFLGKKKFAYIFSIVIVLVSVISLATNGLDQGVDFVGGRTFQVKFEKPVTPSEVADDLRKVLGSAEAKVFGNDTQLKITTKYKVEEHGIEADQEVNELMYKTLRKYYTTDLGYDKFVNTFDGKKIGILQASKIGPAVADDIKNNSYWAVLGSMAIVFLYLMISFRKWQYSLGAIAAVVHDVIFVLGIYSLTYKYMPFNMEIDQHFIAAILTVIGYSMNDTVIVFDRVREYLLGKTKGSFNDIVNRSVNTTISRTINTSLTLLLVLVIMFIFGGESIRGFIFAMLVGIIVGTYSSLFVATPVLVDTISDAEHKSIEALHNK